MTARIYVGEPLPDQRLLTGPVGIAGGGGFKSNIVIGPKMRLSRLRFRGDRGLVLVRATIQAEQLGVYDSIGRCGLGIAIDPDGVVWRFPAIVAFEESLCTFELLNTTASTCWLIEAAWWGVCF